MIPKIIHQIHLGDKPLSESEQSWRSTWSDLHPEWQMIMWNDTLINDQLNITHPDVLKKCKNYSEMSDVLRFEILYQFGGLYIDTDFECLKPVDHIMKNRELVIFKEKPDQLCGAFFACTKNNSVLKRLIDRLPERHRTHHMHNSACKYGPLYITKVIGLESGLPDGVGSDIKTVYPYAWNEPGMSSDQVKTEFPEAVAIHHWNASWH